MSRALALCLIVLPVCACDPPLGEPEPPRNRDAGAADASAADASAADASVTDASVTDASVTDASVTDASVTDASVTDAGVTDAGVTDASVADAGVTDAGVTDAGVTDAGVTDAGVTTIAVVVGGLPSTAVGGFALYSRNSPRLVRVGDVDYLGLNISNSIRLYRRLAGQSWTPFGTLPVNFHRPPTLLVSGTTLNVLYETGEGRIRHWAYTQANTATPGTAQDLSNDAVWGTGNYYIGGAASAVDGALYLCVAVSELNNEHARCGTYRSNQWAIAGIQSYTDHQYLYPNMEPAADGGFWLDLGAYPLNRTGSPYPSHVRRLNAVFRVSPALATVPGAGATYGSASGALTYYTNDIATFPAGHVLIIPARTSHELSGALPPDQNVVARSSATSFGVAAPTGLVGSAYTLQVVGSTLVAVGAGYVTTSPDGVNWTARTFALPGYPPAAWTYGVAQTLQARGGSPPAARLTFVQELTERATGAITLISAELPLGAL